MHPWHRVTSQVQLRKSEQVSCRRPPLPQLNSRQQQVVGSSSRQQAESRKQHQQTKTAQREGEGTNTSKARLHTVAAAHSNAPAGCRSGGNIAACCVVRCGYSALCICSTVARTVATARVRTGDSMLAARERVGGSRATAEDTVKNTRWFAETAIYCTNFEQKDHPHNA